MSKIEVGRLATLVLATTLALSASAARAQDDALADVPTAADEAVLGASPLREEPAPAVEREAPPSEGARVEPAPAPAADEAPWPGEPAQPPVYATWWFWTAIAAVAIGITSAIVVGLTTEAPASSVRSGLVLRF